MTTTIRKSTVTLGIAGLTALAGIGFATGPAMAGTSSETATAHSTVNASATATSPVDYADDLVRAWGAGDDETVDQLATADVVDQLSAHSDDYSGYWARTGAEGAAGTTYVNYENTKTGEQLSLGVQNEAASQGADHAVNKIIFSQ